MRLLLALVLALWAAAVPGAPQAQVVTDAAGLREIGARLLAGGEPERARALADALLARDPGDVAALLLRARAALAAGDPAAAAPAARRAHALAPRGPARFVAARLAARAHADLGQDLRAQFWLRRSLADSPSAEATRDVAADLRALRARNPLAVSLSFGLAPSSNVNGGSASETIVLPGLPFEFVLSPDARALSGLRVEGGATLSYRLARGPRAATFVGAQVSGRTYLLSPEARERAPEARGSDYADVVGVVSLTHRWRRDGESGPSSASAALGQTWYDGEPYLRFAQATFERTVALGPRDRLDLVPFVEWTDRLDEGETYWTLGGRARLSRTLGSGDRASLSAGWRDALSALADVAYDGATIGAGYDRRRLAAGLRLGVSAEVGWRRYGRSDYAAGGREDVEGSLRLSAGVPRLSVLGFEPVVGIEASRTWSDVPLFDQEAIALDLGFRSRL